MNIGRIVRPEWVEVNWIVNVGLKLLKPNQVAGLGDSFVYSLRGRNTWSTATIPFPEPLDLTAYRLTTSAPDTPGRLAGKGDLLKISQRF